MFRNPTKQQINQPTNPPTNQQPTNERTNKATNQPTHKQTNKPTNQPTNPPSNQQANERTNVRTNQPTKQPTNQQTNKPINQRTNERTNQPTNPPSNQQANERTNQQSNQPTNQPTNKQTNKPTNKQTNKPTNKRTNQPTNKPINQPINERTNQRAKGVDLSGASGKYSLWVGERGIWFHYLTRFPIGKQNNNKNGYKKVLQRDRVSVAKCQRFSKHSLHRCDCFPHDCQATSEGCRTLSCDWLFYLPDKVEHHKNWCWLSCYEGDNPGFLPYMCEAAQTNVDISNNKTWTCRRLYIAGKQIAVSSTECWEIWLTDRSDLADGPSDLADRPSDLADGPFWPSWQTVLTWLTDRSDLADGPFWPGL